MYYVEQHLVLSLLYLGVKAEQYFVSSNCMFLGKKTLLKIWLNPGLNLTIFWGTGPIWTLILIKLFLSFFSFLNIVCTWNMVIIICGKNGAGLSLTGINFELAIKDLDHFFAPSVLHLLLSFISVTFSRSAPLISGKKTSLPCVFEGKINLHRRFSDIRITESYIYCIRQIKDDLYKCILNHTFTPFLSG